MTAEVTVGSRWQRKADGAEVEVLDFQVGAYSWVQLRSTVRTYSSSRSQFLKRYEPVGVSGER